MGTKESGGKDAPTAQRLRHLREAVYGENLTGFANMLGISPSRWANFEAGFPLSKEIAFKLVQEVDGLTLDWLYFGKMDGLTVQLARKLRGIGARKG